MEEIDYNKKYAYKRHDGMSRCVVLLCGKRFSGKDAFADSLQKAFADSNVSMYRCAFADLVKKQFALRNDLDEELLMHCSEYKDQWRLEMIDYAEQMKRQYGQEHWARELLDTIPSSGYKFVLITDWRFRTEKRYVEDHLPTQESILITVRVDTSVDVRRERGWTYEADIDTHKSETELDSTSTHFTVHITSNQWQYDELAQIVRDMMLERIGIVPEKFRAECKEEQF
jgi:phosphomevalonate kinase